MLEPWGDEAAAFLLHGAHSPCQLRQASFGALYIPHPDFSGPAW